MLEKTNLTWLSRLDWHDQKCFDSGITTNSNLNLFHVTLNETWFDRQLRWKTRAASPCSSLNPDLNWNLGEHVWSHVLLRPLRRRHRRRRHLLRRRRLRLLLRRFDVDVDHVCGIDLVLVKLLKLFGDPQRCFRMRLGYCSC